MQKVDLGTITKGCGGEHVPYHPSPGPCKVEVQGYIPPLGKDPPPSDQQVCVCL